MRAIAIGLASDALRTAAPSFIAADAPTRVEPPDPPPPKA
jgi:hypothetical protein